MGKKENVNYLLPLCAAVFAAVLLIAALIERIAVSDIKYMTVSPDFSMLSLGETLKCVASCAGSSAVQLLILYIAGFSSLSVKAALITVGYRGAAIGTACSFIANGSISFSREENLSIAGFINIPAYLMPILLYAASTAIIFAAATASYAHSREIGFSRGLENSKHIGTLRYTEIFLIFAGAATVFDAARLLCL